jgi:hypothetical protein
MPIEPRYAVRVLIGLALFGLVSAGIGTVLAVAQDGAGVPASYLAGTPFRSFLGPGLILGGVGGTQLAAAVALWRRWDTALLWTAIAAFGMLLWIFVELAMIQHYSWLQSLYFAFGVVELVLVLALLGIAPRVMRRWDADAD